jgi:hypothetical protein
MSTPLLDLELVHLRLSFFFLCGSVPAQDYRVHLLSLCGGGSLEMQDVQWLHYRRHT